MAETALLSLEAALGQLLATASPLPVEQASLADAFGRFLAEAVVARVSQPPADVSAMDGYALRFADLQQPLRIVGESAAGRGFAGVVGAGEAVRIFTGAPIPAGADTVAVQEDAVQEDAAADGLVVIARDGPQRAGAHIRRAGLDFRAGGQVAQRGDRLTPARLGLLAAAGHAMLPVVRRPRVALIATGDELVLPGCVPGPDQIVSSNGPMLAALLRREGADVQDLGIVADTSDALATAFVAAQDADIIVTIGGASVGDHDLVKPVLQSLGARLDFWRIAIRPGKPMLAGRLGDAQVIGLPGNPVSAFVCATLFLLPLLRHMAGDPNPVSQPVMARASVGLKANGARRDFMRATLARDAEGALWATPCTLQDSSMLGVLAGADALLIRPENDPARAAGATVPVLTL